NFDREDLDMLWQIIQKRFASSQPKNFSDDFLLTTLKAMFEKPGVEARIWKSQRGINGRDEDDNNNDHDSSSEGNDQDSDSGDNNTQSDNEKGSDSKHETDENEEDVKDDEEEKDYEFVKTSSNSTNDEDETNEESKDENNVEGDEDKGMDYTTNQFDDDVDIRLNEPVNTDEGLIQKEDIPHMDVEIVSPMDVHVHHEVPSNQTPTLLTVHVSVITESSPIYTIVIPQSLPSFTPPPPQSTPTPPPTTEAINPLSALLNFASVFQFKNKVSALEKNFEVDDVEDFKEYTLRDYYCWLKTYCCWNRCALSFNVNCKPIRVNPWSIKGSIWQSLRDEDDSNNDHDSSSEGNDQDSDSGDNNTQSDNEKGSDSKHEIDENEEDVEDDEEEKDYEFVKTSSNSTNDKDETNEESKDENNVEGDEDKGMDYTTNQFDDDVDIRLNEPVNTDEGLIQKEGVDAEMINVYFGKEVIELKKDDLLNTQVTSLVNKHLDPRLEATRDEFMSYLSASITVRITEQVKIQLPHILSKEVSNFAPLVIKSMVNGLLKHVVLAKESSQPKFTYEAATSLTEFELKKILIDKIDESQSYLTAIEHGECYDRLIKSYDHDKSLFSTYDKVYSLKRSQKDKDKDEDPSAGSDRRLKKRKTSKHVEPKKDPKAKESKSRSSKGTKSQSKSSGKSVHAEEPEFEVADSKMPQDQKENLGDDDEEPKRKVVSKRDCFTKPKQPQEPTDPD
nr:hypothetical protein [Tanacetum cinerariifolium]